MATIPYFYKTVVTQTNVSTPLGTLTGPDTVQVFTTDVTVLNHNTSQDATIVVYATTASTPTDQDIILENILNAKGGAVRLSCKLFPPRTKFFIVTTAANVVVSIEGLGDS